VILAGNPEEVGAVGGERGGREGGEGEKEWEGDGEKGAEEAHGGERNAEKGSCPRGVRETRKKFRFTAVRWAAASDARTVGSA